MEVTCWQRNHPSKDGPTGRRPTARSPSVLSRASGGNGGGDTLPQRRRRLRLCSDCAMDALHRCCELEATKTAQCSSEQLRAAQSSSEQTAVSGSDVQPVPIQLATIASSAACAAESARKHLAVSAARSGVAVQGSQQGGVLTPRAPDPAFREQVCRPDRPNARRLDPKRLEYLRGHTA